MKFLNSNSTFSNHSEVVQAVMQELPKQKEKEEFDFFK